MCIYCNTTNYRKIYEAHHGSIPNDQENRTYDIHHIDGNHSNNNPENLKAVSLQEHYSIHYNQEDWSACQLISLRLGISKEERSRISRLTQEKRVHQGTHPWLSGRDKSKWKTQIKNSNEKTETNNVRNLCKKCRQRPVAINYYKAGQPFYRSKCDHCSRGGETGQFLWQKTGYKKKSSCEHCKFSSKHAEQFDVFHVDGDLKNCRPTNLKTVCANCARILYKEGVQWRRGDLIPDF